MIAAYGRIQGSIRRLELAVAGNAALKFFGHFLHGAPLERVRATGQEEGADGEKKESEGLQARRILKKVTSDK